MYYMGIDIGGTIIKGGLINSKGKIIEKVFKSTEMPKGKKQVLENILFVINELMNGSAKRVKAIGIGASRQLNIEKGIFNQNNTILGWKKSALEKIIQKRFKKPVVIDGDANCFILAEQRFGAAKKCKNAVGLLLGTTLGAGIVINNEIYRGANNCAGSVGIIPYKGIILEEFAGSSALKRISQMMGKRASGLKLYELAKSRNSYAKTVFTEYTNNLVIPLAIIANCFDPEIIVLGGGVSESFPYFKPGLMPALKKCLFKESAKKLKIVKYKLKHAETIGAACLVMK